MNTNSNKNDITGTWNIRSDEKGVLVINSVDQENKIKGTVFGKEIQTGSFNPETLQIDFVTKSPDPSILRPLSIYIGHLYFINVFGSVLAGFYYMDDTLPTNPICWLADKLPGGST